MATVTVQIASRLDEHNTAEFFADEVEVPEPRLVARSARFEILDDMGTLWLYRREPEHCPPMIHLLGAIGGRADLLALLDCLSRAVLETDPLTTQKAVVV